MREPVIHYTDGRNAWKIGVLGFLIRFKGIALTAGLTILSMGIPWWWTSSVPAIVTMELKHITLWSTFAAGALLTTSFFYLRYRTIRSLDTKYHLHQLVHDIRDKQSELHDKLAPGRRFAKSKLNKELEVLLIQICESISKHFSLITRNNSISVAIRLAVYDDKLKSIVYKTYARSKGLNSNRKKESENIPVNQGIPRFLRDDKSAQGVLLYKNLISAEKSGTYQLTKNDKLYPDEIKTMMVAPLNAWGGSKQDMIGLLYVTSREKNVFQIHHVDSMAFAADITASAVANSIGLVNFKCNNQEMKGRREYAKIL